MKRLFKNQHGFSHHLLLPIAVIVAVTFVGGYILKQSHAASLNPYSCPAPQPTIEGYSQGPCVKYLQFVLKNYASQTSVTVTGLFDQATVNGVKNLQRIAGLTVDGIVGPKTWTVVNNLNAIYNPPPAPPPPPPSSATYDAVTPGIMHGTGSCIAGLLSCDPTNHSWMWNKNNGTGGDSTTRYMQYGPYKDLVVPAGKQGFRVCYNYKVFGDSGVQATVLTDVTFNNTGTRYVTGSLTRTAVVPCNNVYLSPGLYKSMEFRFKVTAANLNAEVILSTTTVNPF
ncbi:MAG TPA: peptidoglycan-binding domain-containing protein [Patescibacteria group bacterium]|nr:peptidoglycan-binding domain-containing protein [Patescibacteria group bacterium]